MGELKTRKEIETRCLNFNSIFRSGKKRRRKNTLLPLLLSFLVFASLVTAGFHSNPCCNNTSPYAYGQQTEKDPAFQDSYWTDKTVASGNNSDKLQEREVGPGEGIATLAVVLVNKAQSEITAVKGYLNLPQEFQAVKTRNFSVPIPPTNSDSGSGSISNSNSTNGTTSQSNASANNNQTTAGISGSSQPNIAVASYDSIIAPGEEFTLYFDINILNSANLGLYIGSLDLVYSKVLTPGDTVVRDISIPFRIPGKVILDIELQDQYLTPAQLNKVNISIINKGSADANSAIVTISNANENSKDGLTTISSSVGDSEPEVIRDTANDTASSATSASLDNSTATTKEQQANRNTTLSSSLATIGTQRFDVGRIGAGETVSIAPLIYPSLSASETLQSMNVEISYGNQIGNRENFESSLGIVVSAQPTESNFDGYFSPRDGERVIGANVNGENGSQNANNVLTAGEIEEVEFTIEKTAPSTVEDAIVSITPSSDSVKVLGSSRWSFETIENSTVDLKTEVFASEDLIGKPIQFNVDIDYILNGISKSESLSMGMYVDGKIAISAYDFGVSVIGDDANLVTNLLNEGNMDALFTTVELIPPSTQDPNGTGKSSSSSSIPNLVQRYPPLQYVGDLAENSPLPISIPVEIPNGTKAGDYPVFMKVSYKDNLRDNHELIVNGTVEYTPEVDESAAGSGGFFGIGISSQTVLLVVAAFAIVVILLIIRTIRKKRRTKKLRSLSDDKDSKDELDSLLKK